MDRLYILLLITMTGITTFVFAETDDPNEELFEMSLEELMEVPVVVSASRQAQRQTELSVPVSILTADDIHYSGLTNIPELLQFVPGVDSYRHDRSRYIVGVRGMHSFTSDRTLVLIDGKNAMNPVFGMPDWLSLPVGMEDIERIEVLRGPGGGVWGANAYTGVINIITKKASAKAGTQVSTTGTEYGDFYTHLRTWGNQDEWSWRVSTGYDDMTDSDSGGAGSYNLVFPAFDPLIPQETYYARDFSRIWKLDTWFGYDYSDTLQLSFGGAYSKTTSGDREISGYYPMRDVKTSATRLFTRADFQLEDDVTAYLQWYGNYSQMRKPHLIDNHDFYDNILEGQLDFTPWNNHQVSMGANGRWTRVRTRNASLSGELVPAEPVYDEQWLGAFVVDRIRISDRLSLELQGRGDYYSETGFDWSARTAALYALDDGSNHVIRGAFGRAFRAPNMIVREATLSTLMGFITLIKDPSGKALENETTYSLEAGYTGRFSENLTLGINSYYQRMENLIGAVTIPSGMSSVTYMSNIDGAYAYGGELEVTYQVKPFSMTGFYSYNALHTDENDQNIRAFFPAKHKAGFRMRWTPDENWTVNANYIYRNAIEINLAESPPSGIDLNHRLDLTVSRKLFDGAGELMVGVTDIFNKTNDPLYEITDFTSFDTPGRTFFARFQMNF